MARHGAKKRGWKTKTVVFNRIQFETAKAVLLEVSGHGGRLLFVWLPLAVCVEFGLNTVIVHQTTWNQSLAKATWKIDPAGLAEDLRTSIEHTDWDNPRNQPKGVQPC